MSKLRPISHKEFINRLKLFGFMGPYAGGKHLYMVKGEVRLTVPNPHTKEIGVDLLKRLLSQAEFSREEWIEIN